LEEFINVGGEWMALSNSVCAQETVVWMALSNSVCAQETVV